ncbi:MAG: hypothetical protein IJU23_13070 [Proteobacteria bacterium]|nr:hypothetical protein [Pseudomonadota bacterium]
MKKQMRVKNLSYLHAGYGRRQLIFLLGMLAMMLIPVSGYAKGPCDELGNNIEWTGGLQEIIMMMQANDMEGAKKKAKALSEICATAPLLNYLQGKIAESTNEKKEALYFYQKASENTYTFAVAPDTAKKIWYARYESEYPDRTESAVTEREAQISSLNDQIAAQKANYVRQNDEKQKLVSDVMWAGAGIGLAGLAIAGGGIGMLFATRNDKYDKIRLNEIDGTVLDGNESDIENKVKNYKYKPIYLAGWAMVGAGAVLTITGTILTGIYGYQFTHPLDDGSVSWHISPLDISLQIAF